MQKRKPGQPHKGWKSAARQARLSKEREEDWQIGRELERKDAEIERLRAALKPFAGAVYYDNGDITTSYVSDRTHYVRAYFALRPANHEQAASSTKEG